MFWKVFIKTTFASVCVPDEEATYPHYIIQPLINAVAGRAAVLLQQTITVIARLRQPHITNQRAYNRSFRGFLTLTPSLLTNSSRINSEINLNVDYIPVYDEIVISSSISSTYCLFFFYLIQFLLLQTIHYLQYFFSSLNTLALL